MLYLLQELLIPPVVAMYICSLENRICKINNLKEDYFFEGIS